MNEILLFVFVFAVGFIGSFVGSVAAGSALITVPGLLLLGLPPHIALATSRLGNMGFKISSLLKFLKHKFIVWKLVLPMCILSALGAALGARILIEVETRVLSRLVGVLLLFLLPILFLRKNIGVVQKEVSKKRRYVSHLLYFLSKTWGGFFSPGNGFFLTYISLNGYGLTLLQAKGTSRIPDLVATISAATVFIIAGVIDYKLAIMLFLGTFAGGYVGSHVAIKKGDAWIKPIIAVFIIIASLKLII